MVRACYSSADAASKAAEEKILRKNRYLRSRCPDFRTPAGVPQPPGPCRPKATAPWLPPTWYMSPARSPVRPVKNPSKLPVAPAPQLGLHVITNGLGLGRPWIGVPLYAEKYWSR